jgi:hypothetical protein
MLGYITDINTNVRHQLFLTTTTKKMFLVRIVHSLNRQIIQHVLPMFEWALSDHLSSQTS